MKLKKKKEQHKDKFLDKMGSGEVVKLSSDSNGLFYKIFGWTHKLKKKELKC